MADPDVHEHSVEVMGTTATVLLRPFGSGLDEDPFERASAELTRLDHLVTRFRRTSALQQLNASGEGLVDPDLLDLLQLALRLRRETGGAFDPTVHDALARGGRGGAGPPWQPGDLRIDAVGRRVELAAGTQLDLGAIAKGWAAERTCAAIAAHGSVLVQVGTDIAVHVAPGDEPWAVGLAGRLPTLDVTDGGVSIASQGGRRWARSGSDGSDRRHVIDPRTGLPVETDVLHAAVTGTRAPRCDAWATAAVVLGADAALEAASGAGVALLVECVDGRLRTNAERASD